MGKVVLSGGGTPDLCWCPPSTSAEVVSRARAVLVAVVTAALVACAPHHRMTTTGTFIEEFEGFPIYYGDPGRSYRVLGPVYCTEAAARGVSPMKRAAVTEARRQGADAILVGVTPDRPEAADRSRHTPDSLAGPRQAWRHAMAIAWE